MLLRRRGISSRHVENARNFVYLQRCVYSPVRAECIVGGIQSVDSPDLLAADGADGLLSAAGFQRKR